MSWCIFIQENFYHFARENNFKIVSIYPGGPLCTDGVVTAPVDMYVFSATRRYAFCLYPFGLNEHDLQFCGDIIYVRYPSSPEAAALVNFDASISICLQQFRLSTASPDSETHICVEKFMVDKNKKLKTGIVFMDSEKSRTLQEMCSDGDDFHLSLFGDDVDF